jgi:hypothetical protein
MSSAYQRGGKPYDRPYQQSNYPSQRYQNGQRDRRDRSESRDSRHDRRGHDDRHDRRPAHATSASSRRQVESTKEVAEAKAPLQYWDYDASLYDKLEMGPFGVTSKAGSSVLAAKWQSEVNDSVVAAEALATNMGHTGTSSSNYLYVPMVDLVDCCVKQTSLRGAARREEKRTIESRLKFIRDSLLMEDPKSEIVKKVTEAESIESKMKMLEEHTARLIEEERQSGEWLSRQLTETAGRLGTAVVATNVRLTMPTKDRFLGLTDIRSQAIHLSDSVRDLEVTLGLVK